MNPLANLNGIPCWTSPQHDGFTTSASGPAALCARTNISRHTIKQPPASPRRTTYNTRTPIQPATPIHRKSRQSILRIPSDTYRHLRSQCARRPSQAKTSANKTHNGRDPNLPYTEHRNATTTSAHAETLPDLAAANRHAELVSSFLGLHRSIRLNAPPPPS